MGAEGGHSDSIIPPPPKAAPIISRSITFQNKIINTAREFTTAQWEETAGKLTDQAQRDQLCGLRPAQRGAALVGNTVEVLAWVSWEKSAEKLKNAWPFVERGGVCLTVVP